MQPEHDYSELHLISANAWGGQAAKQPSSVTTNSTASRLPGYLSSPGKPARHLEPSEHFKPMTTETRKPEPAPEYPWAAFTRPASPQPMPHLEPATPFSGLPHHEHLRHAAPQPMSYHGPVTPFSHLQENHRPLTPAAPSLQYQAPAATPGGGAWQGVAASLGTLAICVFLAAVALMLFGNQFSKTLSTLAAGEQQVQTMYNAFKQLNQATGNLTGSVDVIGQKMGAVDQSAARSAKSLESINHGVDAYDAFSSNIGALEERAKNLRTQSGVSQATQAATPGANPRPDAVVGSYKH